MSVREQREGSGTVAETGSAAPMGITATLSLSTIEDGALFRFYTHASNMPWVQEIRVDRSLPLAVFGVLGGNVLFDHAEPGSRVQVSGGAEWVFCVQSSGDASRILLADRTEEGRGWLADQIKKIIGGSEPASGRPVVTLWRHAGHGLRQWHRRVEALDWAEIAQNYPQDVRAQLDWLNKLDSAGHSGRLILWHGEPGTGKTTAIRALIRSWHDRCRVHVISDPERLFANADYLLEMLSLPAMNPPTKDRESWSLIVAEDADEFLRADARQSAGASLSRLLSLGDGLIGHGLRILVLLTTNEEVGCLHPALTRPGRCLAQMEFTRFSPSEAARWLGTTSRREAPMTLAELFLRKGDLTQNGVRRVAPLTAGAYI